MWDFEGLKFLHITLAPWLYVTLEGVHEGGREGRLGEEAAGGREFSKVEA